MIGPVSLFAEHFDGFSEISEDLTHHLGMQCQYNSQSERKSRSARSPLLTAERAVKDPGHS